MLMRPVAGNARNRAREYNTERFFGKYIRKGRRKRKNRKRTSTTTMSTVLILCISLLLVERKRFFIWILYKFSRKRCLCRRTFFTATLYPINIVCCSASLLHFLFHSFGSAFFSFLLIPDGVFLLQ